jgi:hypothetical protein
MVIVRRGGQLLYVASLMTAALLAWLTIGQGVFSGEPAADDDQRAALAPEKSPEDASRSPPDPQARTQALSLGFFLLACIIVGGALLLTLVVTWGNRTRRLARSPLPPVSERNELWFLKPKKPQPEGERDAQNEPRSDPPERE